MQDDKRLLLTSMFHTAAANRYLVQAFPEVAFCFWGFPPSASAWKSLHIFLHSVFQPRVFMASETRENCYEILMIVSCQRLKTAKGAKAKEHWEEWLQTFFDNFCMSAGVVVFEKIFGDQMLSCMERIEAGKRITSNIGVDRNRDFQKLWNLHRQAQKEKTSRDSVVTGTNLQFTRQSFMQLFEDRRQLLQFAQEAYSQLAFQRIQTLNMGQHIAAMQRLGILTPLAVEQSFAFLGLESLASNGVTCLRSTRDTVVTVRPRFIDQDLYLIIRGDEESA
jgi:hypothetical protein